MSVPLTMQYFVYVISRWSGGTSGILESLGYKDGYRIDVDIPDGSWAAAPHFHDILIFNTGHW